MDVQELINRIEQAKDKLHSVKKDVEIEVREFRERGKEILARTISTLTTGIPGSVGDSQTWGIGDSIGSALEGLLHQLTGTQDPSDDRLPHAWGSEYNAEFKDRWVRENEHLIREAAHKYNLPPELLSGVIWLEAGGEPDVLDSLAYEVRRVIPFTGSEEKTSFGQIQMQIRTASRELYRELGYARPEDVPEDLSKEQEQEIIAKLEDPAWSIELAARHLNTLREQDAEHFGNNKSSIMTDEQMQVIATRYNRGSNPSLEQIQQIIENDPGSHGQRLQDLQNNTDSLLR